MTKAEDQIRSLLHRAGVKPTASDIAFVAALEERRPQPPAPRRGTEPALVHDVRPPTRR